MKQQTKSAKASYVEAGVDIQAATKAKQLIKGCVSKTFRREVLTRLGHFGGLFKLTGYDEPILVSSVDGVGTKVRIARALNKHDTIGIDLVNHCVNDILTSGAEPLFFLDYIAMDRLIPERVESILKGLSTACQAVGCALIGGETAEMPGVYAEDNYDLAGFIVGVVERNNVIDEKLISVGDAVLGLSSSGLHTNGYSLVRKIFSETRRELDTYYSELGRTLGEELLEPHRCYYPRLKWLLPYVKGLVHITGGGFIDNPPRLLPTGLAMLLRSDAWNVPPIFKLIQKRGNVRREEMYHVFNMGIGMLVICSPKDLSQITQALPDAIVVGEVIEQIGKRRVVIV